MKKTAADEKKTLSVFGGSLLYLLSLLYGIIFAKFVIYGGCDFGMLITTVLFYIFFLPVVIRKKADIPVSVWMSVAVVLILALCCAFFAPGPWKVFAVLGIFLLLLIQLPKFCGYSAAPLFSPENFFNGLLNAFISPVEHIMDAYKSFAASNSKGKKCRFGATWKVLLGIAVSLPFVALLFFLFSQADKVFSDYLNDLLKKIEIKWIDMVIDVLVGFFISLYIFPLIYTCHIAQPRKAHSSARFRGLDAAITSSVVFVCDFVYLAFVFVQFSYLFSPDKKLPGGYIYAVYSRSGFFELLYIIIATFALTALSLFLTRKKDNGGTNVAIKISLTVLSLCNLIIVASATYRLGMYIKAYGLTRSRIVAAWAIFIITLLVIAVLCKIWIRGLKISKMAGVTVIAMIILLNLINTDAIVARYNISRHLDYGKRLDYYYLSSEKLSTAAVPEIMRLYEEGNASDKKKAAIILASYYPDTDNSVGALNHQDAVARQILESNRIKRYNDFVLGQYVYFLINPIYYSY